jgi:transcriptional regulator with XRE-family HTH domain
MYFSSNIKILRKRKRVTQDDAALSLGMKRSTYSGYENKVSQPTLDALIQMSEYYNVSADVLLKVDLSKYSEFELRQIEMGSDVFVKGSNLRILSTTVGADNEENIELVNLKAKAGYTRGFADPEYIKVLPTFRLPFLSREKKYRTFQLSGDSMLPIPDGAYVTCEFIENWYSIPSGEACVILTLDDGLVFKCIENKLEKKRKLGLYSLNSAYEPYHIDLTDIKEIWKFVNYISPEMPDALPPNLDLHKAIANLQSELHEIKVEIRKKK